MKTGWNWSKSTTRQADSKSIIQSPDSEST